MTTTARDEPGGCWSVPWIHQPDWHEMLQCTGKNCARLGGSRAEVMGHIDAIIMLYEEVEAPLSRLCEVTCPTCNDVCCLKATVWYDQRDIIIYHLVTGLFPEHQITRSAKGICCNLGENGCRLPRLQRPFICTWYICPEQTTMLKREAGNPEVNILEKIHQIKELRKRIGTLYLQV
ncbi:hypothetical protein [Desulforhopalus sp. IMCC35007]|uniref:hypothetical protein n=1 Tax=Desulforhopalus sp. IMCC35007 TaxID=2569543 RepID=UPI0010AEDF57|nr:hypothetical protein [Desulforhopalus sp. IMCC35007]TKB06015.1 hypothetical protein FCL48_22530 [Desulforhopalus sp. IMCC35007]